MTEKPWGGVFNEATDRRVEQFTESISFDQRLYAHDILGSQTHARMLAHVGLMTAVECEQIDQALEQIRQEIEQGKFSFRSELEDIHMHIEAALVDRLGDVGRKLHTARSRNDQVSTDLRLWVRDAIDELDGDLAELQRVFVEKASADQDLVLPAFTHLRPAQPVLAAHYWLAYCEKLARDRDRLADCRGRTNQLPLGAAALAGTSLPIDRQFVAQGLGFDHVMANSLDAACDRDFLVEFVFALVMIAEHLSTWAEEWIIWSTAEFSLIKLPEAFCTGSSIMPQKINPDVLELVRGKTARVVGNLQSLLMLIKALPLAYNRDLQEDKPPLFDSFDTVRDCLKMAAALSASTEWNRESIARRVEQGYLDATSLMEYFIARGVPQRSAHTKVGALVRSASEKGTRLADLPLSEFQAIDPAVDASVYEILGPEGSVRAMASYGSTGPAQVRDQLENWKTRLEA